MVQREDESNVMSMAILSESAIPPGPEPLRYSPYRYFRGGLVMPFGSIWRRKTASISH